VDEEHGASVTGEVVVDVDAVGDDVGQWRLRGVYGLRFTVHGQTVPSF
jgi:hypothetical protein